MLSYLYGPNGNRVRLTTSSTGAFVWSYDDLTFAGKQVVLHGRAVLTDRVGTVVGIGSPAGISSSIDDVGSGYPYGYIYSTASYSNSYEMSFATYENDGNGLYYAMNRYYDPARARFTTADPSERGQVSDPQSWNRYSYAEGDPINLYDPTGLFAYVPPDVLGSALMSFGVPWWHTSPLPINTIAEWDDTHPREPKPFVVKNLSKNGEKYDKVAKTFQNLLESIDPNCLGFLQSGGSNVQDYVSSMLSNSLLAVGDFALNIGAFTGTGGTNLAPGDAAIVVNNDGAFFNSSYTVDQGKFQGGTGQADAFILLHELGHALGAQGFQSDYNNKTAGTANDKLVDQNCQKTISKFP